MRRPTSRRAMLGEMHRIAHEEYPFPGMFTVADIDEAKKGGLDFYYHGGFDEPKNSFTREYGDGGEVDNFFSHNATTRVKRSGAKARCCMQAAIRAHDLDDVYRHAAHPHRRGACGAASTTSAAIIPIRFGAACSMAFRMPRYSYYSSRASIRPITGCPASRPGRWSTSRTS